MGAHAGNRAASRRNRSAQLRAAHKRWLGYVEQGRVKRRLLPPAPDGFQVSVFVIDYGEDRWAYRAGRRHGFFAGPLCVRL